jgi:hypothetical protein
MVQFCGYEGGSAVEGRTKGCSCSELHTCISITSFQMLDLLMLAFPRNIDSHTNDDCIK